VEILGSTTVICTDKTGTLTQNRMRVTAVWLPDIGTTGQGHQLVPADRAAPLARAVTACNNAELAGDAGVLAGDPTEVALLRLAADLGINVTGAARNASRRAVFRFDPRLKLMSTVDGDGDGQVIHVKGAPEEVLARATGVLGKGGERPMSPEDRGAVTAAMRKHAVVMTSRTRHRCPGRQLSPVPGPECADWTFVCGARSSGRRGMWRGLLPLAGP
jgi:magnesium-transporting ATPase (P-type)